MDLFIRTVFISIFIIGIPRMLYGQSLVKISLADAFEILEKRNLHIAETHLDINLAKQDLRDAKNALLPKISFNVGQFNNLGVAFDQIAGQLITGNKWSYSGSGNINAQLIVFDGLVSRNSIATELLNLEVSQFMSELTERSKRIELINLFYDALTNYSIYQASLEQFTYSKQQLELIKQQFQAGTKTLVDISLAKNQVLDDEVNSVTSKNAYFNSAIEIKQLLNLPLTDSVIFIEPVVIPVNLSKSIEIERLINNDPEVKLISLDIEKANLSLKTAKWSGLPKLSLSSSYGTSYSSERKNFLNQGRLPFGNQIDQNLSLNFGINLNLPLLNGFKKRTAISKSKIEIRKRNIQMEKIKMEKEKVLLNAYRHLTTSEKQYEAITEQVHNFKTIRDAMHERYLAGVASSVEFSKTLLDYNQSQFNAIRSKYKLLYHKSLIFIIEDSELQIK